MAHSAWCLSPATPDRHGQREGRHLQPVALKAGRRAAADCADEHHAVHTFAFLFTGGRFFVALRFGGGVTVGDEGYIPVRTAGCLVVTRSIRAQALLNATQASTWASRASGSTSVWRCALRFSRLRVACVKSAARLGGAAAVGTTSPFQGLFGDTVSWTAGAREPRSPSAQRASGPTGRERPPHTPASGEVAAAHCGHLLLRRLHGQLEICLTGLGVLATCTLAITSCTVGGLMDATSASSLTSCWVILAPGLAASFGPQGLRPPQ